MPAHCDDGTKNDGESDIDCGGECSNCANSRTCGVDADCASRTCVDGICSVERTCTDGIVNGNETDEDCGGGTCDACADALACRIAADCQSGVCGSGQCAVPSCTDKVKNAAEADVDCGPGCGGCLVGQSCAKASDCLQLDEVNDPIACASKQCKKTIAIASRAAAQQDTSTQPAAFSVNIDKETGAVGHRLLVVAVSALNLGTPVPASVTYSGKALQWLESDDDARATHRVFAGGNNVDRLFGGIYVLGECDLLDTSLTGVTVTMPVADWAGATVDAILFENVDQDLTELGRSVVLASAQNVSLTSGAVPSGSWFFGAAISPNPGVDFSVNEAASPMAGASSFFNGNSNFRGIATAFGPLNAGSYTFAWNSNWESKIGVGLVLNPATTVTTICP